MGISDWIQSLASFGVSRIAKLLSRFQKKLAHRRVFLKFLPRHAQRRRGGALVLAVGQVKLGRIAGSAVRGVNTFFDSQCVDVIRWV